jgi:hypothetical protein
MRPTTGIQPGDRDRGQQPSWTRHTTDPSMTKPSRPQQRAEPDALMVERLLAQLQQRRADAGRTPRLPPALSPPSPPRPSPAGANGRSRHVALLLPSVPGVWARVALSVLLAVAVTQWPYVGNCGLGLGLKIAAIAVVAMAGVWAAARSWRRRMAAAHVTALLVVVWGLALLTVEVMPHTRYGSDPAAWLCPPAQRPAGLREATSASAPAAPIPPRAARPALASLPLLPARAGGARTGRPWRRWRWPCRCG